MTKEIKKQSLAILSVHVFYISGNDKRSNPKIDGKDILERENESDYFDMYEKEEL